MGRISTLEDLFNEDEFVNLLENEDSKNEIIDYFQNNKVDTEAISKQLGEIIKDSYELPDDALVDVAGGKTSVKEVAELIRDGALECVETLFPIAGPNGMVAFGEFLNDGDVKKLAEALVPFYNLFKRARKK